MYDKLNVLANRRQHKFLENGRQQKYFGIWKATSIISFQLENVLNILEDKLNFFSIGRRHQILMQGR
jgi:hypothetical protein